MDEYTATLKETARQISATIPCRVCGEKHLRAFVQMGVGTMPARIQVDCRNPACAIFTVTHDFDAWCAFDVSAWGAQELPGWGELIAALAADHNDAHETPRTLCDLVETYIHEQEGALFDLVLRDFREQLREALPYTRRAFAERWLHIYTGKGA